MLILCQCRGDALMSQVSHSCNYLLHKKESLLSAQSLYREQSVSGQRRGFACVGVQGRVLFGCQLLLEMQKHWVSAQQEPGLLS